MMPKQQTSQPAKTPTHAQPAKKGHVQGHILVVIANLQHGGAERVVSRLTHEWVRTHKVTVAVFDKSNQAYQVAGRIVDLKAGPSKYLFGKAWRVMRRGLGLIRLIQTTKPTHLIGFMEDANFPLICAGLMTAKLSHTTISVHKRPAHLPGQQGKIAPILYHLPKRIVAVSHGIKGEIEAWGLPVDKIDCIANPAPAINSPPPPPVKKNSQANLLANIF